MADQETHMIETPGQGSPRTTTTRGPVAHDVDQALRATHTETTEAGFGWVLHGRRDGAHLLVTCEPPDAWRTMPGPVVRSHCARRLDAYADTLAKAGFGVGCWGRNEPTEVLLVTDNQAGADEQAPAVWAYLAEQNAAALRRPPRRKSERRTA